MIFYSLQKVGTFILQYECIWMMLSRKHKLSQRMSNKISNVHIRQNPFLPFLILHSLHFVACYPLTTGRGKYYKGRYCCRPYAEVTEKKQRHSYARVWCDYTVKKSQFFSRLKAGISLTKLFLAGNIFPLWSLEFSRIFPFPAPNSQRILLNQLVFLFAGRSFPDIPVLQHSKELFQDLW